MLAHTPVPKQVQGCDCDLCCRMIQWLIKKEGAAVSINILPFRVYQVLLKHTDCDHALPMGELRDLLRTEYGLRFGMKCHAGVDAGTGYVHTIEVTPANVHDVTAASELIREDDEVVYGDSGYLGIQKRPEVADDEHLSSIDYRINLRPGRFPKVSDNAIDWTRRIEKRKSSVRCKVEHIFRIIKCQFGYRKVRYRGLKKNENRLYVMFACANLYLLARAGRTLREA